jgi:ubiquinol-cytochrome c reductase iron-sulfur subunit
VAAFGGLIKNPWKQGKDSPLLVTDWRSENGERVYMRRDTGKSTDVVLIRAGDLDPGAMETVFPFRESERNDPQRLREALKTSDSPVMLIRLRPNVQVIKRAGQEDFNYGTYFAYSKICTHMGCPTSLYEDQTMRILCPCHQSQFQANEYAKPVFGPAPRPLAQLPIAVDDQGYFYARSDFIEPIGPAFWERNS